MLDNCGNLDDIALDTGTVFELVRSSLVPVILSSLDDGRLLEVSDSFLTLNGYSRDELIGQSAVDLDLWIEPQQRQEMIEQLRNTGSVSAAWMQFHTRDGNERAGRISSYTIPLAGESCVVTIAEETTDQMRADRELNLVREELEDRVARRTQELTETNERLEREIAVRRQTETDLKLSEEKWRSLANTAVDYIIIADRDGNVLDMNRGAQGQDAEELIGHSIYRFVPREFIATLRETVAEVLKSGRRRTVELTGLDADRGETWYRVRIGPFLRDTEIAGVTIFVTDINKRKLAEQKLLAEEALLRHLLDMQDRERRLIACEIHDGLIQDIVGAHLLAQSMDGDETLTQIKRLLIKAVNEGRRLISELRPMILDEMGLVDAIEFLVEEEEAKGIHVDFSHRLTDVRLPPLLEGTIFRIVQEAVNNARRHAQVSSATVRLTQVDENHVVVEIDDRGVGFDPLNVPVDRFGLSGIRERARLFGGGASIESKIGGGTRVTVKLPIELPVETTTENSTKTWRWGV